jgi:uncharacterized membrane protein
LKRFFFLFTLTLLCLRPVSAAVCDDSYRIWGRVVDEAGEPIQGVDISVYTDYEASIEGQAHGYFIKKTMTDEDGEYSLRLDRGTYTLVYGRDGYDSETQTVTFQTVFDVDLRDLVMTRGLKVDSLATSRVAKPGQLLRLPFTVENAGTQAEEVEFNVSGGWEAYVADDVGEVHGILLNPGDSASLTLTVHVPIEPGSAVIQLDINGYASISKHIRVEASGEPQPILGCGFSSLECVPGGEASYSVTLTNPYHFEYTATLSIQGLPEGWGHSIHNDEKRVRRIALAPGGSAEVFVEVETSEDTAIEEASFTLVASSDMVEGTLGLSLSVVEQVERATLKTKYPDQSVELGGKISYVVEVENPRNVPETLSLDVHSLPEGWKVSFRNMEGLAIGSVQVDPNSSEEIQVVITPDPDAGLGGYPVDVVAESSSLRGEITLNISLVGSYDARLVLSSLYEKIKIGEVTTIVAKVVNAGYSDITNVWLDVESSSDNVVVEVEPYRVTRIPAGGSATLELRVKAVEGTATGDYVLSLRAESNEDSSELKQVRVTVEHGVGLLTLSVGLLVAGLGSVAVIYKRVRRR